MQREGLAKATKVQDLSLLQREKVKKASKTSKRLDSSLNWMSWAALKPGGEELTPATERSIRVVEPPKTMVDTMEEMPTGTPEIFLAYLQRDINCCSPFFFFF